jgi:[ribosomal protein S18]-alanine N-acetyltransferase
VIEIRRASREDLEALFTLDQACFRPGISYSKAELKHYLFGLWSISLVAENEGRIAGFAILEFVLEKNYRVGHIVTIDVAAGQRRRGVGRMLIDALLELCRTAGVALARLEVAVDNDVAREFYRVLEFRETGRIRGFYMGKLDALRMERALDESPGANGGR